MVGTHAIIKSWLSEFACVQHAELSASSDASATSVGCLVRQLARVAVRTQTCTCCWCRREHAAYDLAIAA
jgi:hypothetical protein